jgi:hypothetical protein
MSFVDALEHVMGGGRVARRGWEPGPFIFLVKGSRFAVSREPLLSVLGEGTEVNYQPHIDICNSDGSIGVWAISQSDVLARDWYYV